jgi:hypothetical protein
MSARHPSERRLAEWAEGARDYSAARHAHTCGLCQARLEALTELTAEVTTTLEANLVPSRDFAERLRDRLEQKLTNREALAVLSDLLDVGPTTSRLLMETDREEDRDNG